jgi:dethiobiotin synthetase
MNAARLAAPFSCFVTGTDTGVGKTLVASALVHLHAASGWRVAGMKPVAAGAVQLAADHRGAARWQNDDVDSLAAAGTAGLTPDDLCVYLLEHALAPHIAADLAGVRIEADAILRAYARLRARVDAVVVEGVGGFRVPLAPGFDTADLAVRLQLPVVLVVGLRLGCLNHAVLTAEAIAARGLALAAWVGNRIDPQMHEVERNVQALASLLPAPLIGVVPPLARPSAAAAAACLDTGPLAVGGRAPTVARGATP